MNIQYTLIRAKRKSIGIRISDTGEVIVRAPARTPVPEIEAVLEQHAKWIDKNQRKAKERQSWFSCLNEMQTERLRNMAKTILTEKTAHYAVRLGVSYQKVTVTRAKRRLGSCSTGGNICYSLYLLFYPDAAVDYVVVHELAHLIEPNHSKNFYRVIERCLPDWKERRELLQPEYMDNPLTDDAK